MPLSEFKAILQSANYECMLADASENSEKRLIVFLNSTNEDPVECLLEITVIELSVPPEFRKAEAETLPVRLQFKIKLPFKTQDLALGQVASLILFINRYLDLPGFELDELEGDVFYRYVWLLYAKNLDRIQALSLLGAIQMNLSFFTDMIEMVANGQTSFNELLSQLANLGKTSS